MKSLQSNLIRDQLTARISFFLFLILPLMILLSGCTKDNTVTTIGDEGSLLDPHVMPRVVATYPAESTTGPFNLYASSAEYLKPHFVIQFNKIINTLAFQQDWISIQGFDRPVSVRPLRYFCYYCKYPFLGKSSQSSDDILSNVLGFSVYDSSGYLNAMRYRIGQTYSVKVNAELEDFNENHLQQPYQFSFTPEPYFRFVSSSPGDRETGVYPTEDVRVSFNSPVDATIFPSVHLVPSVAGQWSIQSDSSSVVFQHFQPFPFNTLFTCAVDGDAKDVVGNQIHSASSLSFSTLPFKMTNTNPSGLGQFPLALTQFVSLYFSGSIDTGSVRGAFRIIPDDGIVLQPFSADITFGPSAEWRPNTAYTVTLSTNLKADDGTHLASPVSISFTTDRFRVSGTYPNNGSIGVDRGTETDVYFTTAIDTGSVRRNFSINPNIAGYLYLYPSASWFGFRPITQFAADTTYTVTIAGSLRSMSGYTIGSPFTFSFRTGD